MNYKNILTISILALLTHAVRAQAPISYVAQDLNKIAIPSPTVSGILNFTNTPVGMNTGTPDISIPIYTINTGKLTVPIILRYSGNGIRVNENSGNVGLGWTLMAEGIISQNVIGIKDNSTYQQNGLDWIVADLLPTTTANYILLNNLANNSQDGAPDLFTFSFPGHSGKFINADQLRLLPEQNLEFSTYNNADNDAVWKVIDETGIQYFFEAIETTANKSNASISSSKTWYLTKIRDPDGVDSITFEYENTYLEPEIGRSYDFITWQPTGDLGQGPSPVGGFDINYDSTVTVGTETIYRTQVHGKQLKKIDFANGSIEYDIAWNDRQDLTTSGSDEFHVPRVGNIFIKDKNGAIIQTVHLDQSYFQTSNTSNQDGKRLKLDAVSISPTVAQMSSPVAQHYKFSYNTTSLPVKSSKSIDYWGYYNGANNATLIPPVEYPELHYHLGANRNTNPTYATAGMLSRIDYPTGGYAQFNFGAHIKLLQPYTEYSPSTQSVHFTNPFSGTVAPFWGLGDWTLTIPDDDMYNNITATLSSEAFYPSGSSSEFITHASTTVYLVEYGNDTLVGDSIVVQHFVFTPSGNYTKTNTDIHLERGKHYRINIYTQGAGCGMTAHLTYNWPHPGNTMIPSGCCRINSIKLHDTFTHNDVVKNYSYSSVELFNTPMYYQEIHKFFDPTPDGDPNDQGGIPVVCDDYPVLGLVLNSNSIWNINAPVSYEYATESLGTGGSTSYQYNTNVNAAAYEIPFTWRMGLLKSKKIYNSSGQLVHQTDYNNMITQTHLFAGHTATHAGTHPCSSPEAADNVNYPIFFNQKVYSFPVDWIYTDTVRDIDYTSGVTTTTINKYDNPQHKEVTRTITTNSDGSTYTAYYKYPTDFSLPGSSYSGELGVIKLLQTQHKHNLVIEQYTQKTTGAITTTISARHNVYQEDFWNNYWHTYPAGIHTLDISAPVTNFSPLSISGASLSEDSRYISRLSFGRYDGIQNILEEEMPGNSHTAYIWAYQRQYPIAKAQNAAFNHIAFTSFETDESVGNWNFTPAGETATQKFTGGKSYLLSAGNITFGTWNQTGVFSEVGIADTLEGQYIVSYWKRSGTVTVNGQQPTTTGPTTNGWTYCEHLLSNLNGAIVSGTTYIDELRLYPSQAEMESYTYKPLIGITSYDDGKNEVQFYEYDTMNRLISIKDQFGKIIKSYTYQYQGAQ